MCRKMEMDRQAKETATRRERELAWLCNRIAELENNTGRRSRKKQINQLKYEKRRIELQIAFSAE